MDVCSFTQDGQPWYFVNLTGFGFVTDVAQTAHQLKRFGDVSYVLGVFRRMLGLRFYRSKTASVKTDPPKILLPDGELFGSTPTQVAIHPRRVRYFA